MYFFKYHTAWASLITPNELFYITPNLNVRIGRVQ